MAFFVSARRGAVIWAYAWSESSMNLALNWHACLQETLDIFSGRPASMMDYILQGSADIPSDEKIHPNQETAVELAVASCQVAVFHAL